MQFRVFRPDAERGDQGHTPHSHDWHEPDDPTVAWVIAQFLEHAGKAGSARAGGDRKYVLDLFREVHGDRRLSQCKPAHLEIWLTQNADRWRSAWTQQRVCNSIQRPFNWASRLGLIARNPFLGVTRRRGESGRAMEDWEFRRLLRRSKAIFRRLLIFLRYTGCRPGEMAVAEWAHLNLERGVIVLPKHKTSTTQREPKPRLIYLHPIVLKLLVWLRLRMKPGQRHLFVNTRGNPWNRTSLGLRMRTLRRKCALAKDCKLYGLRHGFGTRAAENGVELKTLAELMGHTDTRITETYIHLAGKTKFLQDAVLRVHATKPSADKRPE